MHIELYIPGLLAAPVRFEDRLKLPELPALQTWLARSKKRENTGQGRYAVFGSWLGVNKPPVAALCWLAAAGEPPGRNLLLAQTVHLQAGIDDVILSAVEWLAPDAAEQNALGEALAAHFPEVRVAGNSVFVELAADSKLETHAPYRVQGRRIGPYLPKGGAALRMHAWMNEAQMLLHTHAVNDARRAEGRMVLNGIWVWGEGELPRASDITGSVYARTPVMHGFAKFLGKPATQTPGIFALPSGAEGQIFIEIDDAARNLDADDPDAWADSLQRLDRDWLTKIINALRTGEVQSARLHGGDGFAYTLTRKDLAKFWRRGVFARSKPQIHFEE